MHLDQQPHKQIDHAKIADEILKRFFYGLAYNGHVFIKATSSWIVLAFQDGEI